MDQEISKDSAKQSEQPGDSGQPLPTATAVQASSSENKPINTSG
jgi:hypothetical protein